MGTHEEPEFVPGRIENKICTMTLIAAFNSIGMAGGDAFEPANGESGYKRMKGPEPVRTKDGWTTMLPYALRGYQIESSSRHFFRRRRRGGTTGVPSNGVYCSGLK